MSNSYLVQGDRPIPENSHSTRAKHEIIFEQKAYLSKLLHKIDDLDLQIEEHNLVIQTLMENKNAKCMSRVGSVEYVEKLSSELIDTLRSKIAKLKNDRNQLSSEYMALDGNSSVEDTAK